MINGIMSITAPGAACAIGIILSSFTPTNEAFVAIAGGGIRPALARNVPATHKVASTSLSGRWRTRGFARHEDGVKTMGIVRPRTTVPTAPSAAADGDTEMDLEQPGDSPELVKEFYSEVASRWNTTVEGAIEEEKDLQFDRAIYDELRERRDFGFEQDLTLELEKRNISQELDSQRRDLDASLEGLPGVSSTTTPVPSAELTPRDVISTVLEALKNNDHPHHNHGVEVFIRFLAPSSAMRGVEMEGVARYLAENRNRAMMHWDAIAYPRPLTISGGRKKNKAFQRLQLKDTMTGKWHPMSVYLTLDARTNCWLIESIIMKGDL